MVHKAAFSTLALIALAGTTAGAQVIDWLSPVDGNWSDPANWMSGNVPDASGEEGVLGLTGAYTVTMDSFDLFGLQVPNPAATFAMPGGQSARYWGSQLINDGTISINSNNSETATTLYLRNSSTLIDGAGTINMSHRNPDDQNKGAALQAWIGVAVTIGANQTVQGSGRITGLGDSSFVNNGTILANDPLYPLILNGGPIYSGSGAFMADGGTMLIRGSFTDITFSSSQDDAVTAQFSQSLLDNVTNLGTLSVPSGATLSLVNTFTNNGTVRIGSEGMFGTPPNIRFADDCIISGNGSIEMSANGDAELFAFSNTITTFGTDQTIRGAGEFTGVFVNNGTINPSGDLREIHLNNANMTLTPTSHLIFDLGGPNIGEYDRMPMGSSDIALDGTLTVNIDDGYVPVFGDLWEIIDGGNHTGEFTQVNSPNAPFGLIFKAVYEGDRMYVVLSCEADLNSDGAIDFFDVSAFLAAYSSGDLMADFTGDGQLNFFDVSAFLQVFSAGCP